jgi:hypothetical protein
VGTRRLRSLELLGETVPRPVLRGADGWWDVVPQSTAIRVPRVLLWLTVKTSEHGRTGMWFLGIDWGEHHHDLCLLDQDGRVLAARRIADGLAGAGELHQLVAAHAEQPGQVAVGIETDRGLLVAALLAAVTRSMRSTPRSSATIAAATAAAGPSPTAGTPRCWPSWSAPTATTTGRSPATARWPRRSRSWPERTRA